MRACVYDLKCVMRSSEVTRTLSGFKGYKLCYLLIFAAGIECQWPETHVSGLNQTDPLGPRAVRAS